MRGLLADFQHAWRLYRRTPAASAVAVGALAVAMAFVAAFFSLYVDLILRPHPGFEQSDRLVTYGWNDGQNAGGLPNELIARIADETATLEAAAGTVPGPFEIGPEREQIIGEVVTREFFGGVRPRLALGRGFERAEHEAAGEPAVVISHDLWQRRFDGRRDVLGTRVELRNGMFPSFGPDGTQNEAEPTDYRIVGVMVAQFTGTTPLQMNATTSVWVAIEPELASRSESSPIPASLVLRGIGLRAPNATAASIVNELSSKFRDEFHSALPSPGARFDAIDGLVFDVNVHRDTQRQLQLFLAASVLLALVAAANVSLFLLARAPGRRRELGIRMAVGAPLRRIARQLASEATLLVAAAAVLGLLLSIWLTEFLRGLTFLRQAQWRDVALFDWRVLVMIGAFLLILTVLVSLAPILGLKRLGIAGSSRQVAARATIAQRIAGTAQIAVAGTLGGAAVAFAWYLGTLMFSHPGYETRDLYAARYSVPVETLNTLLSAANGTPSMERLFVEDARRREAIMSLPGVTDVSLGNTAPGESVFATRTLSPPDDPNEQVQLQVAKIDSRFVDVLGPRLLHGRGPTDGEFDSVLVNRTLALRFWGREDVVGERLQLPFFMGQQTNMVVGVLEDLSFAHPSAEVRPLAFTTFGILSTSGIALIKSTSTAAQVRQGLESLVETGALEVTINEVTPLSTLRTDLIAPDRARGFLTIGTAALVVALAALGFYGTQRYLVTAGRREYAIRASLGAGPRALGRLVLWRGWRLGLLGLALGSLLAFVAVAWLRDDFVSRDVSPLVAAIAVAVGLTLILTVASLGPARQARRTQPAPLLRED